MFLRVQLIIPHQSRIDQTKSQQFLWKKSMKARKIQFFFVENVHFYFQNIWKTCNAASALKIQVTQPKAFSFLWKKKLKIWNNYWKYLPILVLSVPVSSLHNMPIVLVQNSTKKIIEFFRCPFVKEKMHFMKKKKVRWNKYLIVKINSMQGRERNG